ncbi:MAG: hypothetical protein H6596_08495 [Flavobacteriales bacterium]|nr:hypothetical protein [Flavobacteriales bacterium]
MTLTLTTTGNGTCNAVTDQVQIAFTPAPVVNAGADGAVCANNAAIALNGSVTGATGGTWSGGSGTFSPNANTLNASYTPSAAEITAGSVTLTLTSAGNGTCNAVSDQVTWTITPAPTANAGADQTLCANNADAVLNGSFTVATGAVWSGGSGSYSPGPTNMGGHLFAHAGRDRCGKCDTDPDHHRQWRLCGRRRPGLLNFTPPPVVNAGADITACANNASVVLNGSVGVASGGIWSGGAGSFVPNNTTLNATYTPTSAEIAAG